MLLSQRKYAEHRKAAGLRGGSLAAVQKAIAAGRIVLVDGLIDAEAADAAWAENTDPVKTREVQTAVERKREAGPSVKDQQLELLTEKTLTARTKRLRLEGEVIEAAEAERAIGEMVETAKTALLRIPEDLADRLAASKDAAECRSIMEHEIREALAGLEQKLAA